MIEKIWFRLGGISAGTMFAGFIVALWNYTDLELTTIAIGFAGTILSCYMVIKGDEHFFSQRRVFLMSASVTVLIAVVALSAYLIVFLVRSAGFW